MIIVDRALQEREARGDPVRVALIGAGFMGRAVAMQIIRHTSGMTLVAVYSRNIEDARRAYREAGIEDVAYARSAAALDAAMSRGTPSITDDPDVICQASAPEAVIEATGAIEFGAGIVLRALENGKHVVMMSAELDGTVGPILKRHADRSGLVLSNIDGDQPGVIMNLYRFVVGLGARPVLCGNIKGLMDRRRNPDTQQDFAREWGQKPHMVASFADGTKISFEQAIVANATGMRVSKRGMHGPVVPSGTRIEDADQWYPLKDLLAGGSGIVDYVVGAEPSPGVFVLATYDGPQERHFLRLYKLGSGPLYCFYTPYHLCHFEVPMTVARAVLFGDATIAPLAGPRVDVVATAKVALKAGQVLDGIGFYMTYGQTENADLVWRDGLLPMGLAESCRLRRDVAQDEVLRLSDVEMPNDRLVDRLRTEQDRWFFEHREPEVRIERAG